MKFKKSLIILSVLLVVAIIVTQVIAYMEKPSLTERKDFAIKDTENIDSIFLANRTGDYVLLRKKEESLWTVNGKANVAPDKIERLLKTISSIEAKNPVAQAAQKSVVNTLATDGIKVEIYQKGKKAITYYVGNTTADEIGTFMYIDGSTIPFVVHIPGFRGYLSPRYSVKELDWRDKAIFDTPIDQFAAVEVAYPDSAQNSFVLSRGEGNNFTISQNGTQASPKQEMAKLYAAQFAGITFETYLHGYSDSYVDSLREATPKCIITVKRVDGSKATLRVFYKPVTADTKSLYDDKGNLLVYDTDNYFALIDGNPELITVQDYLFRHIFKRYSDFIRP